MELNLNYIQSNDILNIARLCKPHQDLYMTVNNLVVRTGYAMIYKSSVEIQKPNLVKVLDKYLKSEPKIEAELKDKITALLGAMQTETIQKASPVNTIYIDRNKDADSVSFYELYLEKKDAAKVIALLKANIPSITDDINRDNLSLKSIARTLNTLLTSIRERNDAVAEGLAKDLSDYLNKVFNLGRSERTAPKKKTTESGVLKEKSVTFAETLINQESIDVDALRKSAITYQSDIDNYKPKDWRIILVMTESEAKVGFVIIPDNISQDKKDKIKNHIKAIFNIVPPEHNNIRVTKWNQTEPSQLKGFVVPIVGRLTTQNAYPMLVHLSEPTKAEKINKGNWTAE